MYDGSAKSSKEELWLNDCLETGHNYIPHIFDMLASFRSYPVGLTVEIEKAFLMVSIKEDRNTFRFLWFNNPDWDRPKIAQFRFNRLLFGLWPSPLVLGGTIAHHLSLYKQSEPDMAVLLEKITERWWFTLWSRRRWEGLGNLSQIEEDHGGWRIQSQKMEL